MLNRFSILFMTLTLGVAAGARTPGLADICKALSSPYPYSSEELPSYQ